MIDPQQSFHVITGGPGSGKTTLIEALRRAGYATSVEAGRAVILAQEAIGGSALPWQDRALFAELMLSWEIRSHAQMQGGAGPCFFDRGVPDVMGYLDLCGLAVPGHVAAAADIYRYNTTVFVAPPWRDIFVNDRERRQDFDEACRTFDAMVCAYSRCGYALVELPRASVSERLRFVLDAALPRARRSSHGR